MGDHGSQLRLIDEPASNFGDELDFYETPARAVEVILPHLPLLRHRWGVLEPAAGRGAILDVLWNSELQPRCVAAVELHLGRFQELESKTRFVAGCRNADFLAMDVHSVFPGLFQAPRLIVMNPPYSAPYDGIGLDFVEKCLQLAAPDGVVAALLPLDFATGVDRCARIHDKWVGSVYPLRRRPHFGGPHSGQRPFAWFVWDHEEPNNEWKVIG
jgi:predicted RNA methylase